MRLEITKQEYEQLRVDIEGAKQELEALSGEVPWFVTELPDRLATCLQIIGRAK